MSDASEGLTRRINIFADKTLLAASGAGTHTIPATHARAAVTDTQIVMMRRDSPRRLVAAAAAGLVAGIGLGYFFAQVAALPSPSPALAGMPAVAPPAAQPAAVPVTAKSVVSAPPTPPLRSLASRLAAGNDLLADATPRFAIQLMVTDARERVYIENYLAEAGRSVPYEKLFVTASGTPEALRLGVLLGPFDSRADAATTLEALPAPLRQFRPFVRTMDAVRDDARRAERT